VRPALSPERLRAVYDRAAGHYDWEHGLLTLRADQRGRRLLVRHAVREGDRILDCGAGTGTTGLMALRAAGPQAKLTLFDLSGRMLEEARAKAGRLGLADRVDSSTGDLAALPYPDGAFDCVLSTYSLCPVVEPARGAIEMYRVIRPGGRLGIAHSTEARAGVVRTLADAVEAVAWHLPGISLGCRAVSVAPALRQARARVLFERRIGVPLYPFLVLVLEKPSA
jgi:demethylmenaquinone methyltransferase / 2-methoxy-6-polyprenyl-1,4-benzoquinol methylase